MSADLTAVVEAIRAHDRFVVVAHENPDGDASVRMLAMTLGLRALGKDASMYLRAPGRCRPSTVSWTLARSCATCPPTSRSGSCSPSTAPTSAGSPRRRPASSGAARRRRRPPPRQLALRRRQSDRRRSLVDGRDRPRRPARARRRVDARDRPGALRRARHGHGPVPVHEHDAEGAPARRRARRGRRRRARRLPARLRDGRSSRS